ncbi:hypothetical protein [Nitrosomonas sp.]|uniref:hypothetical protein n=1 Tax=Nitrosomonas sp. TaxID=42353 RepID=UPI001D686842|nr:hypothetical protein [Nitrosomonas sp.]MBX3616105.1 hypothetical protein [Nitrosomonas sp.]
MPHLSQHQTTILQLFLAMFNASPGLDNLRILASQLHDNQSLASLTQWLANSAIFYGKDYAHLNSEAFAHRLVDDLFGEQVSNANKMLIYDFIVNQSAAGVSQDQLITELVNALSVISTSDRNWGQAAIQHNINGINKILDHLLADTFALNNRAIVKDHMIMQIMSGGTLGETIIWAVNTVGNVDLDNIVWGNASRLFKNRLEVSKYYSVDMAGKSIDFISTQKILEAVTEDSDTVVKAKMIIDSKLNNSGSSFTSIDFQLYQTIKKIHDNSLSMILKNLPSNELMVG